MILNAPKIGRKYNYLKEYVYSLSNGIGDYSSGLHFNNDDYNNHNG